MFGQHDHDENKEHTDQIVTSDNSTTQSFGSVPADDTNDDNGNKDAGYNEGNEGASEAGNGEAEERTPAVNHATDHHEAPAPADRPSADTVVHSADELIDLKQQALTKLSPLVDHLDQTPDEKFRTLMMMIQASDDQSLIKQAYETALEIDEEKTRAQALLDIVNEINYFTQNPAKPE